MVYTAWSTGLAGLDRMLKGIIAGDNLVFQVDSVNDYIPFVEPYARAALARGRKVVYFRFANHQPLLTPSDGIEIRSLEPEVGFERFIAKIHQTIEADRETSCYVFDCLSDLAVDWCSDRMLGNFFMLTCPYVYDVGALAYFMLLRNYHSFHATTPISETTQILLDIYRHKGRLYLHPIKVQQRYSPTMHMLHRWESDDFVPVTTSSTIAEILTSTPSVKMETPRVRLGVWNRAFLEAEEIRDPAHRRECTLEGARELVRRLIGMVITREERFFRLAEKYLNLGDILDIWKRMIGTGLIGGKAVGMLLARAILTKTAPRYQELLEPHDSFFIGSDVFYTFLVQNGCWWTRQKQRNPATFLDGAEDARRRILMGTFSADIQKEFSEMLEYFGQSPILVRSSSLLEDNFGNSFAGKYESVFCVNQGPHQQRLEDFMSAVRSIYASTMSEKALRYRALRGMLDRDEQMALLVQRVSGGLYGSYFYPQLAGVGLSFNPYVWSDQIDPQAGVLRLVFGLGTRAVDRADDDYTRIVALNAPQRRPEGTPDEVRHYTQRRVDCLDLHANQLVSCGFLDLVRQSPGLPVELFATQDEESAGRQTEDGGRSTPQWNLTFDQLMTGTTFVKDMREMLHIIEQAYGCPVDTEFTANFFSPDDYRINLVQCRPLQVNPSGLTTSVPTDLAQSDRILEAHGAVVGQSRLTTIDRLIYVVPGVYGRLSMNERYSVARLIGRIAHLEERDRPKTVMLLGPGRWGTSTPTLGVPVSFAEINTVSILCELVMMREGLVPEVSLGTHFFNELVEMDMLYLALFPSREGNFLNEDYLTRSPSKLTQLLPGAADRADVVRVIDPRDACPGCSLLLNANTRTQKVVCYLDHNPRTK